MWKEIKISQYAEDTTMILDGSKKSDLYICLNRPRAFRCDIWFAAKQQENRNSLDWELRWASR